MEILDDDKNQEVEPINIYYWLGIIDVVIFFGSLALLITDYWHNNAKLSELGFKGLSVFFLTSLYLTVKSGDFLNSKWFFGIYVAVPLGLLGIAFKIMHWPYANAFLYIASAGVFVFYTLFFLFRDQKDWTSVLKLGLMCSIVGQPVLGLLRIYHLQYSLPIFSAGILLILILEKIINKKL